MSLPDKDMHIETSCSDHGFEEFAYLTYRHNLKITPEDKVFFFWEGYKKLFNQTELRASLTIEKIVGPPPNTKYGKVEKNISFSEMIRFPRKAYDFLKSCKEFKNDFEKSKGFVEFVFQGELLAKPYRLCDSVLCFRKLKSTIKHHLYYHLKNGTKKSQLLRPGFYLPSEITKDVAVNESLCANIPTFECDDEPLWD